MAPRHQFALVLALSLSSNACLGGPDEEDSTLFHQHQESTTARGNSWCSSMTFIGDLHGAPATAQLTFEPLHEVGYVSGTIVSQSASYTFFGDTPIDVYSKWPSSSVMWVEVTGQTTGERFRAEINWKAEGFLFTANPFSGGGASDYYFHCKR